MADCNAMVQAIPGLAEASTYRQKRPFDEIGAAQGPDPSALPPVQEHEQQTGKPVHTAARDQQHPAPACHSQQDCSFACMQLPATQKGVELTLMTYADRFQGCEI